MVAPSTFGTFTARQGDTLPILVANLFGSDDAAVDLSPTGTTVRFKMVADAGGALKVDAPATIVNASTGTVSYTWGTSDLNTAGEFRGVFVVTIPGIGSETYPGGEIDISIIAKLESYSGWSYGGDPTASTKDAVRFLIGDTDENNQLLSDKEIQWLLNENIGTYSAAAQAASQLSAKFSRQAGSKRMGDLSVTFTTRAKEFLALAKSLNVQAMRSDLVPMPYAGGISETDKLNDDMDVDVVKRLKVSRIPDIYLVP